ncbi:hypothetical protein [Azohydromonas aeria]|uniref:hypothetical protein n=1 Tax=Azohydromonas aeria TaxID=2590212 RepID=UPI0018DFEB55|nr:hypothetical protein [Azohydromonas aeria]
MADRGNVETLQDNTARTLQGALIQPFEELTIQRAMTLFPTALGLLPGCQGLPSDDFLANLLTGRRSFLAYIRRGFGRDFKNFENYALQKVRTSPAVRARLLNAVGSDEQLLELLAELLRNGVLAQRLAGLTRAGEGFLYMLMRASSSGSCKCSNCGAEMVSQSAPWWAGQRCVLGEAESRFVDRVLYDVLAVSLIPLMFGGGWSRRIQAADSLASLCDAGAHPFRHWLALVQRAYRAKDLTALATRAGLDSQFPDSHLQRCGRGEMLTVDTITSVTARLRAPDTLRTQGMHARALAFTIDFLVAADSSQEPLTWSEAQAVVAARVRQLATDLWLSISKSVRPVPPQHLEPEPLK